MNGFVYFVRILDQMGAIKIGQSLDPADRLIALNIWIPYELELLAQAPGDLALEKTVQNCFADAHIRGEWFRPIPRLLAAIEAVKGGAALHEAIDLSKPLGNVLGMTQRQTRLLRAQRAAA